MVKTKPVPRTRESELMDKASALSKRLANNRVYEGLPEKDRKRIFEVSAVLSEELAGLRRDMQGKGDEIFSVYCGLKEMERELEEIAGFFTRSHALITELKGNRLIAGNGERRKALEKAEWRVNEMKRKGFDSVKARMVDEDLARLAGEADRFGRFGNAKNA